MSMSKLVFAPLDGSRGGEVRRLFKEYPHKDFQLKSMKVSKEGMGTTSKPPFSRQVLEASA